LVVRGSAGVGEINLLRQVITRITDIQETIVARWWWRRRIRV
jgi:hypothetical protein